MEKNNNIVIRFLSNYIDIQPNKVLDFENATLKILSQAKNDIEQNEIELSLSKILTLSDVESFFRIWIQQAKIYIKFKTTLNQIIKQNV